MFSATGLELKTALKLANFELGSVDADSYIHIKWEQIKLKKIEIKISNN